jgi:hypothetical protein
MVRPDNYKPAILEREGRREKRAGCLYMYFKPFSNHGHFKTNSYSSIS